MAKKRFDPLWEVVDEKVPLQGGELDVDAKCPWCQVIVHLGLDAPEGETFECGLCGGVSKLVKRDGGVELLPLD